jgi:uncharacterized membrane protein
VLIAAMIVHLFNPAYADFTICNKNKNNEISVAMVAHTGNILRSEWESAGWYRIAPNKCDKLIEGASSTNKTDVYLSIVSRYSDNDQRVILTDSGPERFFCVNYDTGFKLRGANLNELENCPSQPGYDLQLFTIKSENKRGVDMTFSVGP